jgi:hypothetical protein
VNDRPRLLFVYNADSGLFNTLADIGHKVFAPQTYACRLCAITHGWFNERAAWRDFIRSLDADCEFLHRDDLYRRYPACGVELPAVLRLSSNGPVICLDAARLSSCRDLEELKFLVEGSLGRPQGSEDAR